MYYQYCRLAMLIVTFQAHKILIIIFAEGIMFYLFRLAILFHLVQYLENFILCFRLYSKKINFKHIAEFMIFSMF